MIRCCRHCQRRRAGCHGDCLGYRAERENHLRQAEVAWREKQGRAGADGVLAARARKMEKRRRGKA
jgi:hypothetical protein